MGASTKAQLLYEDYHIFMNNTFSYQELIFGLGLAIGPGAPKSGHHSHTLPDTLMNTKEYNNNTKPHQHQYA